MLPGYLKPKQRRHLNNLLRNDSDQFANVLERLKIHFLSGSISILNTFLEITRLLNCVCLRLSAFCSWFIFYLWFAKIFVALLSSSWCNYRRAAESVVLFQRHHKGYTISMLCTIKYRSNFKYVSQ